MDRFSVLWAALLLGVSVSVSLVLPLGADAVVGESEERIATEEGDEPLYTAEESVERGILRASEWQLRSAVSGTVGALCGLIAFQLLTRSVTTRRGALGGFVILLIPAFAWLSSPAISMLGAWHTTLPLGWVIVIPGIVASTTLVTAGLVVRAARAWRETVEARPLTPREKALLATAVLIVAFAAFSVFQWRWNLARQS
jgi:hypothetical protein